jgi:hypothetical protein
VYGRIVAGERPIHVQQVSTSHIGAHSFSQ